MFKFLASLLGFQDRSATEEDGAADTTSQVLTELPEDDDINSKGFTQFFSINMNTVGSCSNIPVMASPGSEEECRSGVESSREGSRSGGSSRERSGSGGSHQEQKPPIYRDVQLRVHVRLLKQQEKMKVRLHVKVDPEETDLWVIPEKAKTNDLFFFGDTPMVPRKRKVSDGYHSQSSASSVLLQLDNVPDADEMIPIVREDHKLREFMSELVSEKRGYDWSKVQLGQFVYTKILKKTISNQQGESYTFEETCRVLKDYFIQSRVNVANKGDLVFFEKVPKGATKKKGKKLAKLETDLLAELHQTTAHAAHGKGKEKAGPSTKRRLSTKDKKQCNEAMEMYSALEQHYINYRAVYFEAVDEYEVQVIESRFGYFMCEMQEELLVGNMILSGQVSPE